MKPTEKARPETFADYLRVIRIQTGLTRKQVEALTGISDSYLYALETGGRKTPTLSTLKRLEKAYAVPTLTLVGLAYKEA